ncbi:streptomycin biosynthesis protein StrF [Vallitalea longa]|uniref:Streptomycin biosynthesis protein StrF n=1 Tax=Vallitalea longa TaxID=2936439 RepID=A0A9W6DHG0_9FIRM|nr:glycosyltransferase family protein [Vallitalea longa]GKX30829.1 streptomycin biosynthesis protein StrF [Vallitalea longa]
MNENKIAFIMCVNDDALYRKSIHYINALLVPDKFTVEIIDIRNQSSMTKGYNEGLRRTDAKYKVYLHQDVFIINKNFMNDIIGIFQEHEEIGLLGVIGSKYIPSDGVWWRSVKKVGTVYDSHRGKKELLDFRQAGNDRLSYVAAIDGLMMITQYDIPWREDIFDGWHFYDISQCMEFSKKNYKIAVPYQEVPWCIHDCGIVKLTDYKKYRLIFLDEYKNELKS